MGYVHDTAMSQFIPPVCIQKSAGTWTPTLANNTLGDVRTAADAAFSLYIPILLPSNGVAMKGAYLKSIDVFYAIATAAADDFATVELEQMTLPASGSAVSGASVTISLDAGHDTAAERKAIGNHKMTISLTNPAWVDDGECYYLVLTVDAAATTVFTLWGAVANYTLRL